MHPAPSIIAFTVLAGLGYGLAFVLGLNALDATAISTRVAYVFTLGLISAGLLASTLHLGNPQRAWRALSQWRSSWLSREGVLAILTFAPLVLNAAASVFFGRYLLAASLLGSLGCAATVVATSMIYASLRSVDAWHTGWTTACFLLFALSGGLIAACLFSSLAGAVSALLVFAAIVVTLAAWLAKIVWRRRMRGGAPRSTAETATGLGHLGDVRQFEPPHMTANYLTHEMGFKVARKHADKLFGIAIGAGAILPVATLMAALWLTDYPAMVAFSLTIGLLSHALGMLVERWLFFAEARHSVMSFYGS